MSATLPRLLDRKTLAAELGVNLSTAERIMRKVPKVQIGRRVYVHDADVKNYLRRATSS
jgi:hypothetical protein